MPVPILATACHHPTDSSPPCSMRMIRVLQLVALRNARRCLYTATEIWLEWVKMEPKVPKCRSLALQSRRSACNHFLNAKLTLYAEEIPFLGATIHFLGMPVTKFMSTTSHQDSIATQLTNLLERVDVSPVTMKLKLNLYKEGICPHLDLSFRVLELPDIAGSRGSLKPRSPISSKSGWVFPKTGTPRCFTS